MFERLFPFAVASEHVAVASDDEASLDELRPLERQGLGERASGKRRREFRAGRHVARRALAHLGYPEWSLGCDEGGVPGFPADVAASITHTGRQQTFACCVASKDALALGIDAEQRRALAPAVAARVLDRREATHLAGLVASDEVPLLAFSVKEAVYKCLFPRYGLSLGFHAVRLELSNQTSSSHRVVARVDELDLCVPVSFAVHEELIVSAAFLS